MAYEFHYTPTGTGVISGKEVLEQTEDAINDLGNTAISGVQEALDKAEQALTNSANAVDDAQTALNTANNAEGVAIQAQNDVSTLSGTVTNIGNRVTTAEGNIGNLQGRMTTAEGNITNLQGRMTTAEGNIGNLQTAVSTAQATANSAQQTATTARQQSYVFRYSSTALTPSSTNSNSLLDNIDNLKVGDKVIDSSGVLFSITAIDTANSTFTIGTALVDLATDSDVVHKSGNETIAGDKTFSSVISNDGSYLGNESSQNERTNLCLRSNRDTADKSGAYISRFRANKNQGELLSSDNSFISISFMENETRYTRCFDFGLTDWDADGIPQTYYLTSPGSKGALGTSSRKWQAINGLNPSSLGMPDLSNGIDISSYITNLDKVVNNYTPPSNGWLSIRVKKTSLAHASLMIYQTDGLLSSCETTEFSISGTILPVIANQNVKIYIIADSLASAKFYPCLGNV